VSFEGNALGGEGERHLVFHRLLGLVEVTWSRRTLGITTSLPGSTKLLLPLSWDGGRKGASQAGYERPEPSPREKKKAADEGNVHRYCVWTGMLHPQRDGSSRMLSFSCPRSGRARCTARPVEKSPSWQNLPTCSLSAGEGAGALQSAAERRVQETGMRNKNRRSCSAVLECFLAGRIGGNSPTPGRSYRM